MWEDRNGEGESEVWVLRRWTFPQFHLAAVEGFSATKGPWDLVLGRLDHAYGLWSWVCVYMCVWRDSCPAHLPPLWPATFIINPDDQVAMSLCPCQGMLHLTSELLSDIPWFMFTVHVLLGQLDILVLQQCPLDTVWKIIQDKGISSLKLKGLLYS